MFFNASNFIYNLNNNYNLEIDGIVSELTAKTQDNIIEIDNLESFSIEILEAKASISIETFQNIISDIINNIFSTLLTSTEIKLEPPNRLIIKLTIKNHFPILLKGLLTIDSDKINLVYNIEKIKFFDFTLNSLIDVFSKIPGMALSYTIQNKTAKITNNSIIIYPCNFLTNINLNYHIDDLQCSENSIQLFFKKNNSQSDLYLNSLKSENSYVIFKEGKIKFHNIQISDTTIIIKREDTLKLQFSLTNLDSLLENNTITYNHNREVTITIR